MSKATELLMLFICSFMVAFIVTFTATATGNPKWWAAAPTREELALRSECYWVDEVIWDEEASKHFFNVLITAE